MFKLFSLMFRMNQVIKMTMENALQNARNQRRAALKRRAAIGLLQGYSLAAHAKKQISFYRSF